MPNHYHLLVYLKDGNLSDRMKALSLAYTKGMNARYNRVGSLFQGRFCSIQVDRDAHLVHLVHYIHLNPVKAGLVMQAEEWEFSSFREYAGQRHGTLPNLERVQLLAGIKDSPHLLLEDLSLPEFSSIKNFMLDE